MSIEPTSFAVLYESGPCLVVNKPPGVLTQAPPGIDSLEQRIKDFLAAREGLAPPVYLGVPHRLDRPASGAMVFARHPRATRRLADQFEARSVEKTYWACVAGAVEPAEGTWRDFLRKIPDRPQAEVVDASHPEGREAVLHYRTIGTTPYGSLLEITLETGRTHQIRIQAASRGHPLLGDAQYGSRIAFGAQTEDVRERAIALHARRIAFRHPATREAVSVVAPVPVPVAWGAVGVEG
ncbi:MAG: RluA family pseudouridine synthase [Planctomycetota bacterium]|nr:MAG: RluA family pseudouridine synthase [Planctomycetota bacterium]